MSAGEGIEESTWSAAGPEQLLCQQAAGLHGARVLCMSLGRAQLAEALACRPDRSVTCCYLDAYRLGLARAALPRSTSVRLVLATDLPPEPLDLVALPLPSEGEAELTRELLQQAHGRLEVGGLLVCATDNPRDRWLHAQLETLAGAVTREPHPTGVVYRARRTRARTRLRDFSAVVHLRDQERLLTVTTRPGVFAHRRIDDGARQLIAALPMRPPRSVLDLGCGSGAVALVAAARWPEAAVHAVDSAARAVACTQANAQANGLARITVELNAEGASARDCDLVLANPPYYGSWRIATHFLDTARTCLRPGGQLLLVAKAVDWYRTSLPERFVDCRFLASGSYTVMAARRG